MKPDPTLDLVRRVARGEESPARLRDICPKHGYLAVYRDAAGRLHCPACEAFRTTPSNPRS